MPDTERIEAVAERHLPIILVVELNSKIRVPDNPLPSGHRWFPHPTPPPTVLWISI